MTAPSFQAWWAEYLDTVPWKDRNTTFEVAEAAYTAALEHAFQVHRKFCPTCGFNVPGNTEEFRVYNLCNQGGELRRGLTERSAG